MADNKTFLLNGRTVSFDSTTTFLVQIQEGRKPYRTYRRLVGQPTKALAFYEQVKVKPGKRKRLLMPGSNYPVLIEDKPVRGFVCPKDSQSVSSL